jgi:hypothetical protein
MTYHVTADLHRRLSRVTYLFEVYRSFAPAVARCRSCYPRAISDSRTKPRGARERERDVEKHEFGRRKRSNTPAACSKQCQLVKGGEREAVGIGQCGDESTPAFLFFRWGSSVESHCAVVKNLAIPNYSDNTVE